MHISFVHFIVGPIIITSPSSIDITTNIHSITLICQAIGVPIPNITWTHNGTVLSGSGDLSIETTTMVGSSSVRSVLTVNSAQANNTGEYVCNATSPVIFYESVLSDIATVTVHGKPNLFQY